mgnify:CR=1 FL=1
MNITSSFINLGFHENEIRVFLVLAEIGRATAAEITKAAGLPRTTTYSILEGLIKRGVVTMQLDAKSRVYILEDPNSLVTEIEREKEILDKKSKVAQELITELRPFFSRRKAFIPKIQFYEGTSAVNSMLKNSSAEWRKAVMADDRTWWGYQDPSFVESYRVWLEDYWGKRPKDEKIYLLSNINKTEETLKGKVRQRVIKPVPSGFNITSTIWTLGSEYIVMIVTRQKPHYAFQIKDRVFASNLQMFFKMIWQSTPS